MIGLLAALGMATISGGGLSGAARHAVFSDLRDGVLVLDHGMRVVELNRAAESMLACSAAATIGRNARDLLAGPLAVALDDAIANGEAIDITLPAPSGPRAYAVRSLPLTDTNGAPVGRVIILRDTTAYRHAETLLQATILADASAALASTLDYDVTLQQAARLAIPALGDWCTVYMLEDDGAVRRVAVAYTDGEKAELAAALRRYPPSPASPRSTVLQVMRSGQPVITHQIPDAYVSGIAQDAEHLEIMRRLDFRSSMTVPLKARGVVLGAVAVFTSDPGRRYDAADLALAIDLAQRASLAIDNARLYREAQRAIRSRDEFLSVAAHELKTPLTSMLGFTQLLLRSFRTGAMPNDGLVERALRAIESQSERLSRLVARLLDLARIEGGRLAIEVQPTDLVPLLRATVEAMRIGKPTCSIVMQLPDALVATVDPVRVEQVVTNLLDNAVRHSPSSAPIVLMLTRLGTSELQITVTDRGPGIPLEHRPRIFDRFFQAQSGQYATGMGLGLFICRQIVEQHGGTIAVECPPAGGAQFIMTLPLAPATIWPASAQH